MYTSSTSSSAGQCATMSRRPSSARAAAEVARSLAKERVRLNAQNRKAECCVAQKVAVQIPTSIEEVKPDGLVGIATPAPSRPSSPAGSAAALRIKRAVKKIEFVERFVQGSAGCTCKPAKSTVEATESVRAEVESLKAKMTGSSEGTIVPDNIAVTSGAVLDPSSVDDLRAMLQDGGVSVAKWGVGYSNSVADLFRYLRRDKAMLVKGEDGTLYLVLKLCRLQMSKQTGPAGEGVRRILIETHQALRNGSIRQKYQAPITAMLPGETCVESARRLLADESGHVVSQRVVPSKDYPGLRCVIVVHDVFADGAKVSSTPFFSAYKPPKSSTESEEELAASVLVRYYNWVDEYVWMNQLEKRAWLYDEDAGNKPAAGDKAEDAGDEKSAVLKDVEITWMKDDSNSSHENENKALQYLFPNYRSMRVTLLHGGFSGAIVVQVQGVDEKGDALTPLVVKIDNNRDCVIEEFQRFKLISSDLGDNAPAVIAHTFDVPVADCPYGAMAFELAGACWNDPALASQVHVNTLKELYILRQLDASLQEKSHLFGDVDKVIKEVFSELMVIPCLQKAKLIADNLCNRYKLEKYIKRYILDEMTDAQRKKRPMLPDIRQLLEASGGTNHDIVKLFKVVESSKNIFKDFPFFEGIAHGDLNAANVLIDSEEVIWVIDYATTGPHHNLVDITKMLSCVWFEYITIDSEQTLKDLKHMVDWILAMPSFEPLPLIEDIQYFSNPDRNEPSPNVRMTWGVSRTLLSFVPLYLSKNSTANEMYQLLIPMMAWGLKGSSYSDLSSEQRELSLHVATRAAARLLQLYDPQALDKAGLHGALPVQSSHKSSELHEMFERNIDFDDEMNKYIQFVRMRHSKIVDPISNKVLDIWKHCVSVKILTADEQVRLVEDAQNVEHDDDDEEMSDGRVYDAVEWLLPHKYVHEIQEQYSQASETRDHVLTSDCKQNHALKKNPRVHMHKEEDWVYGNPNLRCMSCRSAIGPEAPTPELCDVSCFNNSLANGTDFKCYPLICRPTEVSFSKPHLGYPKHRLARADAVKCGESKRAWFRKDNDFVKEPVPVDEEEAKDYMLIIDTKISKTGEEQKVVLEPKPTVFDDEDVVAAPADDAVAGPEADAGCNAHATSEPPAEGAPLEDKKAEATEGKRGGSEADVEAEHVEEPLGSDSQASDIYDSVMDDSDMFDTDGYIDDQLRRRMRRKARRHRYSDEFSDEYSDEDYYDHDIPGGDCPGKAHKSCDEVIQPSDFCIACLRCKMIFKTGACFLAHHINRKWAYRSLIKVPENKSFVVLGPAASGKTVLLKRLLVEGASSQSMGGRAVVPYLIILVDLARLVVNQNLGPTDDLVDCYMRERHGAHTRRYAFLRMCRRKGLMFFLFDGLDETGIARQTIERYLDILTLENCRILLSSRHSGFDKNKYRGWKFVIIRPLSHTMKVDLFMSRISSEDDKVARFVSTLDSLDQGLKGLIGTPLLFSLFLALYEKQMESGEGLELMLKNLDARKYGRRKGEVDKAARSALLSDDFAEVMDFLTKLSYDRHCCDIESRDIMRPHVMALDSRTLLGEEENSSGKEKNTATKSVVPLWEKLENGVRSGRVPLLQCVQDSMDRNQAIYRFTHLTFQEFLAARAIVKQMDLFEGLNGVDYIDAVRKIFTNKPDEPFNMLYMPWYKQMLVLSLTMMTEVQYIKFALAILSLDLDLTLRIVQSLPRLGASEKKLAPRDILVHIGKVFWAPRFNFLGDLDFGLSNNLVDILANAHTIREMYIRKPEISLKEVFNVISKSSVEKLSIEASGGGSKSDSIDMASCKSLKSLNMFMRNPSREYWMSVINLLDGLSSSSHEASMEEIDLMITFPIGICALGYPKVDGPVQAEDCQRLPNDSLKRLALSCTYIPASIIITLVSSCRSLRSLVLSYSFEYYGEDEVSRLMDALLKSGAPLEELTLAGINLGDAGAAAIGKYLQQGKHRLKHLDVEASAIFDEGLCGLLPFVRFVSSDGGATLSLGSAKDLETLLIRGNLLGLTHYLPTAFDLGSSGKIDFSLSMNEFIEFYDKVLSTPSPLDNPDCQACMSHSPDSIDEVNKEMILCNEYMSGSSVCDNGVCLAAVSGLLCRARLAYKEAGASRPVDFVQNYIVCLVHYRDLLISNDYSAMATYVDIDLLILMHKYDHCNEDAKHRVRWVGVIGNLIEIFPFGMMTGVESDKEVRMSYYMCLFLVALSIKVAQVSASISFEERACNAKIWGNTLMLCGRRVLLSREDKAEMAVLPGPIVCDERATPLLIKAFHDSVALYAHVWEPHKGTGTPEEAAAYEAFIYAVYAEVWFVSAVRGFVRVVKSALACSDKKVIHKLVKDRLYQTCLDMEDDNVIVKESYQWMGKLDVQYSDISKHINMSDKQLEEIIEPVLSRSEQTLTSLKIDNEDLVQLWRSEGRELTFHLARGILLQCRHRTKFKPATLVMAELPIVMADMIFEKGNRPKLAGAPPGVCEEIIGNLNIQIKSIDEFGYSQAEVLRRARESQAMLKEKAVVTLTQNMNISDMPQEVGPMCSLMMAMGGMETSRHNRFDEDKVSSKEDLKKLMRPIRGTYDMFTLFLRTDALTYMGVLFFMELSQRERENSFYDMFFLESRRLKPVTSDGKLYNWEKEMKSYIYGTSEVFKFDYRTCKRCITKSGKKVLTRVKDGDTELLPYKRGEWFSDPGSSRIPMIFAPPAEYKRSMEEKGFAYEMTSTNVKHLVDEDFDCPELHEEVSPRSDLYESENESFEDSDLDF